MNRVVGFAVGMLIVLAVIGAGGVLLLVAGDSAAPRVAAAGPPAAQLGPGSVVAGAIGVSAGRQAAVVPVPVPVVAMSRPVPTAADDIDPVSGLALIGMNLVALSLVLFFVRRRSNTPVAGTMDE